MPKSTAVDDYAQALDLLDAQAARGEITANGHGVRKAMLLAEACRAPMDSGVRLLVTVAVVVVILGIAGLALRIFGSFVNAFGD